MPLFKVFGNKHENTWYYMKEGIFGKETIFVKLDVLQGVISFAFHWDNSVRLKCNQLL